jgi:hypothetical protein
MKKFLLALLFVLMSFAPLAHAQTRLSVGLAGGNNVDNLSVGPAVAIEVPFLRHFELDLRDTFSPYERHTALGTGYANIVKGGGIIWLTKSFGVVGIAESSSYAVTQVSKSAVYTNAGAIYRTLFLGAPTRFEFDYIQQSNNGITNGIETSHFHGGEFSIDTRFGCAKSACLRVREQLDIGRVLTQGNPACDGNGITDPRFLPCPRGSAITGGGSVSLMLEFPRRKVIETTPF